LSSVDSGWCHSLPKRLVPCWLCSSKGTGHGSESTQFLRRNEKEILEILPKGLIPSLSLLTWVEYSSVGTAPYYWIGSVVCAQNPVRWVHRGNCLRRRYWITISKRNFWDWKHLILQGMLANVTPSLPFGASSWRAVPVTIDLVRKLQHFYRKNFIIT
jgi:hypothetical protein